MAILRLGCEDTSIDEKAGVITFNTGNGGTYARGSVDIQGHETGANWFAMAFSPQANFFARWRGLVGGIDDLGASPNWELEGRRILSLYSGATLVASIQTGAVAGRLKLCNAAGANLAVGVGTPLNRTFQKFDLAVEYPNRVRLWIDDALYIDHDVADSLLVGGVTTVNKLRWCAATRASWTAATYIREVCIATEDLRNMVAVKTLYPDAASAENQWTGSHTAIDESITDRIDLVSSTNAGQDFRAGLSNMPVLGANTIKALAIEAECTKAATGISSVSIGVKTTDGGGQPYVHAPAPEALIGGWELRRTMLENNPGTGQPFTEAEMNAILLNIRSGT